MSALNRFLIHPVVLMLLRITLGGVLCLAGFLKLKDLAGFAENIAGYRLLPPQANQMLAVIMPWQEVVTGLLLIAGVWQRAAARVAALLFTGFGVAVSTALARGLDIHCGCFGTDTGTRIGVQTLSIDMICLLAALWLMLTSGRAYANRPL